VSGVGRPCALFPASGSRLLAGFWSPSDVVTQRDDLERILRRLGPRHGLHVNDLDDRLFADSGLDDGPQDRRDVCARGQRGIDEEAQRERSGIASDSSNWNEIREAAISHPPTFIVNPKPLGGFSAVRRQPGRAGADETSSFTTGKTSLADQAVNMTSRSSP
jgi:hypothetical protein